MKSIFSGFVAVLVVGLLTQGAMATTNCVDKYAGQQPIAVADGNGTVLLPTGQVIRGYPPYERIYGTFPLKDAAVYKCSNLRVAETRGPRFCKRSCVIPGRTCTHVVCD